MPRRLVSCAAGLLLVLLPAAGCGADSSEPAPSDSAEVELGDAGARDELMGIAEEVSDRLGVPGLELFITRDGKEWATTLGVADRDDERPLEPGDPWPLRSITKSFTVTLVLQLADEGELSLDDTVDTWIDGVPQGDEVTVRQLAAMNSGLGDYTGEAFIGDFVADPDREFSEDELLQYALDAEPRGEPGEPGEERVYNNANTLMLGRIVEEVTGEPFADVLEERVLEPLELDQTLYPSSSEEWIDEVVGYSPDPEGELEPDPVNFSVFGPAGAMIAPLAELAAWGEALASGELLDQETQQERMEAGPLEEGPEYDTYGLGIGELEGWWGHTGEGFGFTSLVMHHEETGTTVAIAANVSGLEEHAPTALFRELAPALTP